MAVASYTTDLTTLAIGSMSLAPVDTGIWDESSDAAWDDAGAMVDDINLYYNNESCVSAQFTKDGVGTIMYVHPTAFTIPTDGAVLAWHMWAAPPALALKSLGGTRILLGTDFGNFDGWIVAGSDFPPEFIWNNHALNPLSRTQDYTVGTTTTQAMEWPFTHGSTRPSTLPFSMYRIRPQWLLWSMEITIPGTCWVLFRVIIPSR